MQPKTFSTCADCGEIMQIYQINQAVHPCCTEPRDYISEAIRLMQEAAWSGDTAAVDRHAAFIEEIDAQPPRLLEAALKYATDYGWPVFPIAPGSKVPGISKRAGGNGFEDATTDPATIRAWWGRNSNFNIGIPTGIAFDVIDVDCAAKGAGIWAWSEFRESGYHPDIHGETTTPSGGFHVFVEPTGDGNLGKFLPGVDFRGRGGYIVAPPSVRYDCDGLRYRWAIKPSPVLLSQTQQRKAAA
ncbi:bifunctional DNA primase/polymerase [Saccharopolyspora sp. WRP15-2]|uniref:Bifunctional DNA primase/polymerase n=1 Tax=Saccharopolyspora oryzae TaxID=2997343 RepID=A0ABT4URE1_9PSEU|nr:bifunctional DNA primase/polymerase [Saccharopolyspora oryzae]MDA3624284.1 bifunctional DNA primase/polymerase [Saccharopolyspora oryzae]